MKKAIITYGAFCLLLLSCSKEEDTPNQTVVGDQPLEFVATIDEASSRTIGGTGYQDAKFANTDQIAIFATRTRQDGLPAETQNIYAQFANVGYAIASGTGKWAPCLNVSPIKAPLFASTHLDMYAYYPFATLAETNQGKNIIQNYNDLRNISFRILQNQTLNNLNFCNIMKAIPVLDQTYGAAPASRTVTLQFKHIMSLLEFMMYKDTTTYYLPDNVTPDPDANWKTGDQLFVTNVIVRGEKISTEGVFDLTGPTPNVRITQSSTSKSSLFKTGTPTVVNKLDAYTGPTKGVRRHVIIPPVEFIPANVPDPAPGQQGDMEILIELYWIPQGESTPISTNRRYIVKGMQFDSNKKYILKFPLKRKVSSEIQVIRAIECQVLAWDNVAWSMNFN